MNGLLKAITKALAARMKIPSQTGTAPRAWLKEMIELAYSPGDPLESVKNCYESLKQVSI